MEGIIMCEECRACLMCLEVYDGPRILVLV